MLDIDTMDMDDKIKGAHLRGTKYTVSQDGSCPRCGNSNRLYVILDKLFPMGDMPEILHTLIAKGRAILWSSQEKEGYQDPPTFLCRGFCPPDPLGAGFNVNWSNVSLSQILESLDRPLQALKPVPGPDESRFQGSSQGESSDNILHVLDDFRGQKSHEKGNASQTSTMQSSSDKEEETEEDDDDDDDDIDEEELIKQMLAKEELKLSQQNNTEDADEEENADHEDDKEQKETSSVVFDSDKVSEPSTSSSNLISSSVITVTASTAHTMSSATTSNKAPLTEASSYPVSSNGRCPYCDSSDVKYIIMVSENTKDADLPLSLQKLLKRKQAFKMAKGDSQPPSFQCQKCQYGFNLNWSTTSLEFIFGLPASTSSFTIATTATPASNKFTKQTTVPYKQPTGNPSYPPPVELPPTRYLPPIGVPPPVPYYGYTPAHPSYYGSCYPPPSVPPPVETYPFPPAAPLPIIPPPGISPLGVFPPNVPPTGVPPPGMPPPRIPPPNIPLPGMLRTIPPPGIPPPGYSPPAITPVPSVGAWGNYPYHTPSRYPPPPSTRYGPTPVASPRHLPPTQVRPPVPWQQLPVSAAKSVPAQQDPSSKQDTAEDNSKVAAARFEMVLNQIDRAKARVRNEKEHQKKEIPKEDPTGGQEYVAEPNALTDEGQQMAEYDEKPPGEDDSGFECRVIITASEDNNLFVHEEVDTSTAEQSLVASQETSSDGEKSGIEGQQDDQDNGQLLESGEAELNSASGINNEDAGGILPKTVEAVAKETVLTKIVRSISSEKEEVLPGMQLAPGKRTGQTRRSMRHEPAISTEDTDSTATVEETRAVTGRARRSRMSGAPRRMVENLDIPDIPDKEVCGGVEVSDVDMAGSSEKLSQSSAAPETESDSEERLSESLVSSSETETAPAGPRRGRMGRGRKRKQGSTEMQEVVPQPPTRKTRRGAVETEGSLFKDRVSEGGENAEDEKMPLETPVVMGQEEEKEVVSEGPKRETSESTPMDTTVEGTATETEGNVTTSIRTNRRQTRKNVQKSQESEVPRGSTTTRQVEESSETMEEDEAMEFGRNCRSRTSDPRNISQRTKKSSIKRQTRTSLQPTSQDSDITNTQHVFLNDKAIERDNPGDEEKPTNDQSSDDQKNVEATEEKITRRTRAARKSSANTRINVLSSPKSDSLTTEEVAGSCQTKSHNTPVLPKVKTPNSDTSDSEEAEKTPKTRKSRKSRKSLDVKEEIPAEEIQMSTNSVTAKGSVSSRQSQRKKSTSSLQEATALSQDSMDNSVGEEHMEGKVSSALPKKVSRKKAAPVESAETVTKRVTRSRQKK